MAIRAVGAGLIHADRQIDGQRDMTMLIGTFCDYANALKNYHIVEAVRDTERGFVGKEDNSQKRTDKSTLDNKLVMH
jgi:hypothetical protein